MEFNGGHATSKKDTETVLCWDIDTANNFGSFERTIDSLLEQIKQLIVQTRNSETSPAKNVPQSLYAEIIAMTEKLSESINENNLLSLLDKRRLQIGINQLIDLASAFFPPTENNYRVCFELPYEQYRYFDDLQYMILMRESVDYSYSHGKTDKRIYQLEMPAEIYDVMMDIMFGDEHRLEQKSLILALLWSKRLHLTEVFEKCNELIMSALSIGIACSLNNQQTCDGLVYMFDSAIPHLSNLVKIKEIHPPRHLPSANEIKDVEQIKAVEPLICDWIVAPDYIPTLKGFGQAVIKMSNMDINPSANRILEHINKFILATGTTANEIALTIRFAGNVEVKVSRAELAVLELESSVFQGDYSNPLHLPSITRESFIGLMDVTTGDTKRFVKKNPQYFLEAAKELNMTRVAAVLARLIASKT